MPGGRSLGYAHRSPAVFILAETLLLSAFTAALLRRTPLARYVA